MKKNTVLIVGGVAAGIGLLYLLSKSKTPTTNTTIVRAVAPPLPVNSTVADIAAGTAAFTSILNALPASDDSDYSGVSMNGMRRTG